MTHYNIEIVSDKHLYALLDAGIPVLEDLLAIMGNWNGKDRGKDEEQSNLAVKAFESLQNAIDTIKELNEGA